MPIAVLGNRNWSIFRPFCQRHETRFQIISGFNYNWTFFRRTYVPSLSLLLTCAWPWQDSGMIGIPFAKENAMSRSRKSSWRRGSLRTTTNTCCVWKSKKRFGEICLRIEWKERDTLESAQAPFRDIHKLSCSWSATCSGSMYIDQRTRAQRRKDRPRWGCIAVVTCMQTQRTKEKDKTCSSTQRKKKKTDIVKGENTLTERAHSCIGGGWWWSEIMQGKIHINAHSNKEFKVTKLELCAIW